MNWQTVTVEQIQKIDLIRKSVKSDETGMDVYTKIISILTGMTESQVDSLPLNKYIQLKKEADFLETDITGEPKKFIKVNGRRYRCIYEADKMPFARYIEGKTFSANFTENLHRLAASMVMPQKRTLFGWVDKKYDASKHEDYANDMKDAPFATIYHSCVFFYHVFKVWMENSKDYLTKEVESKGMSQLEAGKLVNDLCRHLDGLLPLNR